jgi:hypothetical protein
LKPVKNIEDSPLGGARIWAVSCLAAVALLAGLGWVAFKWVDDAMSSVQVSESKSGAKSIAEGLGLALTDDDEIVYGEVASSFPDSSSYLVVATRSAERTTELLATSGFSNAASVTDGPVRAPERHGPPPSSTLVKSHVSTPNGYLVAYWDPQRDPCTLYISASQM